MNREEVVTPYHEAGHAVMAMACRFEVIEVSVVPTGSSKGHVRWSFSLKATIEAKQKAALVYASGIAADFLHWKKWQGPIKTPDEYSLGHFDDQKQANAYLSEIDQSNDFDSYLAAALWFLQKTEVWPIVDDIAKLLIANGLLTSAEIANFSAITPMLDAKAFQIIEFYRSTRGS